MTGKISEFIIKRWQVTFGVFWLLTFLVYLPAAKAGWVMDSSILVYYYRHQGFLDFINRVHSPTPSLYQFTQIVIYLLFKLFDTNVYLWHLVHVTLHATNCYLLYLVCSRLLHDGGVANARHTVLAGVLLYIICPHISEVIVWEASYHYLQGFLLILVSMYLLQQYHYRQWSGYAWLSGIVYFLATYSLEVFYLTPWFLLSMAIYYRYAAGYSTAIFRKALLLFVLPALLLFLQHLVVLSAVFAHFAHLPDSVIQPVTSYLCKPPKFIFHVLFMGRYFPAAAQKMVYDACETMWFWVLFYGGTAGIVAKLVIQKSKIPARRNAAMLLFSWVVLSIIIITPLTFPMSGMLMFYDRYLYFLCAFLFILISLIATNIRNSKFRVALLLLLAASQYPFTYTVNLYWKHSAYINNRLLTTLPPASDKTILLLNLPENFRGIGMIGAQPEGEFKRMRMSFLRDSLPNKVYDVASYNLANIEDGAHTRVINDSTIHVTLNQWGTWWWYEGQGGHSYENEDYRLDMKDVGHWYELTLKKPAENYLLLFAHGGKWETVNMKNKDTDQY